MQSSGVERMSAVGSVESLGLWSPRGAGADDSKALGLLLP